jgi:hypothetical protein
LTHLDPLKIPAKQSMALPWKIHEVFASSELETAVQLLALLMTEIACVSELYYTLGSSQFPGYKPL